METRLLVALDMTPSSMKTVDYVARIVSTHPEAEITLLHVIHEPSDEVVRDEAERTLQVEKAMADTLALMEKAGKTITEKNFPEKRIRIKVQVCKKPHSIAELILNEQRTGGYGTVVLGRRKLSKREEFLFGSVSGKVMREAQGCAVWIVE